MINNNMKNFGQNSSEIRELFEYGKKRKEIIGEDNVFDFSIGNPNVSCPVQITETIDRLNRETDPVKLHEYTSAAGRMDTRENISAHLKDKYNVNISAHHIYMTVGAAASLSIALKSVVNPGEQVIVFTPYFPEYKVFVEGCGGRITPVAVSEEDFQIDFGALEAAFSDNVSALIINSPNNPTGAVLTKETLQKLSTFLTAKEAEYNKKIYLISDEPYRELMYDKDITLPASCHDRTIICYSYSKSLSLPGERIGYVAVNDSLEEADELFAALAGSGRCLGYVCAPSLMQAVIAENQGVVSDISIYKKNRDILYNALTDFGFSAVYPDGAFYLFVKSPEEDARKFSEKAKELELLLVPSDSFGMTGYVRISYCVSTEQIERSLDSFKKLAEAYKLK